MPDDLKEARPRKFLIRIMIFMVILVLYLVTAVPVGLFLYSVKSELGWNVFKHGGYHAYLSCVQEQLESLKNE